VAKLLCSVGDIALIVELETKEDAIIIAQDEIACLHDMSLEGDIPEYVSDIGGPGESPFYRELGSAI
jgi:hypothetical protein